MRRFALCLFVLLACAVLLAFTSTPAYAVDGVVLINQNTIINGLPGCPGSNPGGFPIVICQPGSYKLSSNLIVTAGKADGIDMTSGGVTLDLNGFAIIGPVTCVLNGTLSSCTGTGGRGIHVTLGAFIAQNFAIRNGTVGNFGTGIEMSPEIGLHGIVEEITADNNSADGMDVIASVVRRCNTSFNGQGGITATGSTVTENVANGNKVDGILAFGSDVIGNTANGNGNFGLDIEGGLFGSNGLSSNGNGAFSSQSATDQGNNDCGTGSPC